MVNILLADSIVGGANRCHIIYLRHNERDQARQRCGYRFRAADSATAQHGMCDRAFPRPAFVLLCFRDGIHLRIPIDFNPDKVNQKLKVWVNTFDIYGKLTHWQGVSSFSNEIISTQQRALSTNGQSPLLSIPRKVVTRSVLVLGLTKLVLQNGRHLWQDDRNRSFATLLSIYPIGGFEIYGRCR